ncbi:putative low molecular weight protein-tyrosine-phosphatase [Austwickia sp. TVS 96-490-7B]|nr:putative low molecular weight protein-tyrosine-phosphatase [Austwickia sp. TVS 96-490-7B]
MCVVCSGNICRSPMGEVVLRSMLDDAGLAALVEVDSAGTGGWHAGDGADPRAVAALARAGYDGSSHVAREYDLAWFDVHDLILAADEGHVRQLRRWADQAGVPVGPRHAGGDVEIELLRRYDPQARAAGDIGLDDPYYGNAEDFERCLAQVEKACRGVVVHLQGVLADR